MAKTLTFDDLDLSGLPGMLTLNIYWRRCIELALRSGSKDQRYGAMIVSGREVLGEGWNRLLKKGEPFPFKTSFFLHAEKASMGDALMRHGQARVGGSRLFVAGFLVPERRPIIRADKFRKANTCVNCTKHYVQFGLNAAFYTETGWDLCSGGQAYSNAVENSRMLREQGKSKRDFRQQISL